MPNGNRSQPARATYSALTSNRYKLEDNAREQLEFALDEIDRLRRITDVLARCLDRAVVEADD